SGKPILPYSEQGGPETYQNSELIQQISSSSVRTTRVLALSKVVERVHHFRGDIEVLLQVLHICQLVTSESTNNLIVLEQLQHLLGLFIQILQLSQNSFPLLGELLWHLIRVVKLAP